MRVAVTGSTGFIGEAVVAALDSSGHEPVRVVRHRVPDARPTIRWDPARGEIDGSGLGDVDAVIHLAGEPIAARRWSTEQKARILDSRVAGTSLLAETMALLDRPRVLISASAIGFYGDRDDAVMTETSTPGSGFLSDVCQAWEQATAPAEQAGVRVVHTRNGLVMSSAGGSLAEQLPFFKLGLGGRFGSGRQWWSWISLDDTVAALLWLLDSDVSGPVNLVAPNPVTNGEYTKTLGRVLSRPTLLPTPKPAVWIKLGRELTEALLYSSTRVEPAALLAAGFEFSHPDLEPALRDLLDRPDATD